MTDFAPTASLANLHQRAALLNKIRKFFQQRDVLEVETPVLSRATVTDVHLHSLSTQLNQQEKFYLQTSPEFAMKRLLAAGSGPIFQITKAFRDDEYGCLHNPEFTMLEWYQPGFDHQQLMDEVDALLQTTLFTLPAVRFSYAEIFKKILNINPFIISESELQTLARHYVNCNTNDLSKDDCLNLLMSHVIENQLGQDCPCFIYDYPASQAGLAKLSDDNPKVAQRFEVYLSGIELANGYHELTDPIEQAQRFENDLAQRRKLNLVQTTIDKNLLAALQHGLPACAGVALGIDRLCMLAMQAETIGDVIAFSIERA